MTTARLTMRLDTPADRVRDILLDAPALSDWNPAFLKLRGDARASTGSLYELTAIRGLHGRLRFTDVSDSTIVVDWSVPLMSEKATWHIRPLNADATEVEHIVQREGALAALLRGELASLPRLRLDRLRARAARNSYA